MAVKFVVHNARTLGIIRTENPIWLEPLACVEGGYDPAKGNAVISPRDKVRKATDQDFIAFGLDPADYLDS